ncbi:tetratricopeptide repeat protein [Micromonospora sp. NPDC093277]|uniref:AfsR/SARP family transcriptional regulator n=1 Tax=Micromonospora sp. NPDC093277 TaxID=3364291 RepID=UPI0037F4FB49
MSLEVKVLGPLSVSADGRPVAVTAGRLRTLLVALALSADEEVSVDRLAGIVWGELPPAHVRRAAQTYLTRLRKVLGPDAIVTSAAGYRLHVDPQRVDAILFERLLETAAAAGDPATERANLVQALALWRGLPFDGLRSAWLEGVESTRLTERYLAALERRIELDLDLGPGPDLVAELRELTARHPLREQLWGHLMTALYRCGRQADALAAYQQLYRLLADELGIEPGHAVQGLHRQILTAHTESDDPGPTSSQRLSSPQPVVTVPRQLPADVVAFTGRAHELADLDRIPDTNAVVITAIDGMAGIGKTALAVHIAHRIASRYPDGQLFIDLHGYTQGMQPMEPADALDHLLRSLDVPGAQIPSRIEERAALYRTRLADRRMLILLDNAATETQVAPLLPGAPGCLVLVTSRHRLAGLDHTHTLSLDTLPPADAVRLFCRIAGENRLSDSPPDLLAELVELCGRLPLAIRVAAARLRSHPSWNLPHLIQRLRDQQHRLVELEAGQRSVTAALDLSYQHLGADLQQTYRLLGLHPGPDIDAYAAAALADSTVLTATRALDRLHEAHLLQESVPGRYRFHDLTRAHAAQTATRDETELGRPMALDRLLDHYRNTAAGAMDAAHPYERQRRPQVPPARTPGPALSDPSSALNWLDGELPNLLAAASYATEHDRPAHLLHLSAILHRHLRTRGRYQDAAALHQQALTTARAACHQAAELEALVGLGHIHRLQDQHEQAINRYQQALQLARATGNQAAELDALAGLGHLHMLQGRHEQATEHLRRSLQLARATGNQAAELDALHGLGWVHLRQGRYAQATDHRRRALQLARATGNHPGELNALAGLGHLHRLQGRYEQATDLLQQALQLARATGYRTIEQATLAGLGHIHLRQGRYDQAKEHYQRLLNLAQGGGDRNFEFEARQGLGRLQHATGHPDTALTHHRNALALADELGQPDDRARAHDGLAHAHHALKQDEQARTHWQHALDILTELGIDHTDDEETTVANIRAHLVEHGASRTA